jgi:CoA:oxalate CoA-transferase
MLSISGFGQDGPEARRPAYASVVHAESGLVQRQVNLTGSPPADPRISIADMNAALHGLVGLLSALLMRGRTGHGQHVDISMLESMVATDDYVHLALDGIREKDGVVVNEIWNVAGGPIVIAGDFRWVWQRLHATFGLTDPAPADAPIPVKAQRRHEAVAAFFATLTDREQVVRALERADLPFGEVKDTATALRSPSLVARGAVVQIDDRAGGTRPVIRAPYRFSDAHSGVRMGAPFRGEHNRDVLREWLDLDAAAIAALEERGVLLAEKR